MANQETIINAKKPFTRQETEWIRRLLHDKELYRDLALFNIAIDTMLRTSDLLRLRVSDITAGGVTKREFVLRQKKTGKPVHCEISVRSAAALEHWIAVSGKWSDDYLWTAARSPHGAAIDGRTLRYRIAAWCAMAGLDPKHYSAHSLRKTRPTLIYAETNDIATCAELLGHKDVLATKAYLGIGPKSALEIARKFEI